MNLALNEFLAGGMRPWWFTFGFGHEFPNCYIVVSGWDREDARRKMFDRFENKWSMQYESAEEAGVGEWNLQEIKWDEVNDRAGS